jgi:hypothetical protein
MSALFSLREVIEAMDMERVPPVSDRNNKELIVPYSTSKGCQS